jgi:hypothetical protein
MRIIAVAAARGRIRPPKLAAPKCWWKLYTDVKDAVTGLTGTLSGNAAFSTVDGRQAIKYNGGGAVLRIFDKALSSDEVSRYVKYS